MGNNTEEVVIPCCSGDPLVRLHTQKVPTLLNDAVGHTHDAADLGDRHAVQKGFVAQQGVVSRKPRNFRQPINMACLALGR